MKTSREQSESIYCDLHKMRRIHCGCEEGIENLEGIARVVAYWEGKGMAYCAVHNKTFSDRESCPHCRKAALPVSDDPTKEQSCEKTRPN
jgi:hypothetical protein